MRSVSLILFALIATSCGPSDHYNNAKPLTLKPGKVERWFGCHIALEDDFAKHGDYATLRFACRVPESALIQERWWGDGPKPKVVTLDVGDCILLELGFYCVEEISPGKSVSLQARYMRNDTSNTVLKRLPRRR